MAAHWAGMLWDTLQEHVHILKEGWKGQFTECPPHKSMALDTFTHASSSLLRVATLCRDWERNVLPTSQLQRKLGPSMLSLYLAASSQRS
jgi:hypothetical protein